MAGRPLRRARSNAVRPHATLLSRNLNREGEGIEEYNLYPPVKTLEGREYDMLTIEWSHKLTRAYVGHPFRRSNVLRNTYAYVPARDILAGIGRPLVSEDESRWTHLVGRDNPGRSPRVRRMSEDQFVATYRPETDANGDLYVQREWSSPGDRAVLEHPVNRVYSIVTAVPHGGRDIEIRFS